MMAALFFAAFLPMAATAAVLDDVRNTGVFKIGYRADAAPFSSVDPRGAISGYSIGLCRRIAEAVRKHLNLKNLTIDLIAVSGATRFDALTQGHIHILCGATTETLTRRKIVDFTIPTFITGAGFLTRTGGASDPRDLAGRKIGVLRGTTTEKSVLRAFGKLGIQTSVSLMPNHLAGLIKLADGSIDAYFADKAILAYLAAKHPQAGQLQLSRQLLTFEPYALGLPKGDLAFRNFADTVLSRIYQSPEILKIFRTAFGPDAAPTELLKSLYIISSLPE